MRKRLSPPLGVRVSESVKQAFIKQSNKHGGQSEVLRILIEAYIDGRITIAPKQTNFEEILK